MKLKNHSHIAGKQREKKRDGERIRKRGRQVKGHREAARRRSCSRESTEKELSTQGSKLSVEPKKLLLSLEVCTSTEVITDFSF